MQKKLLASVIALSVSAAVVFAAPAKSPAQKSEYPRQQQLIVDKNSSMRTVHRNKNGQLSGSTQQVGSQTFYRDGQGRHAGTARETGNRVVYRDKNGQLSGTAQKVGNQVVFRDNKGQFAGTARETGNRIVYRDKNGQISGTAQKVGNRIIYRDSKGRYAGSSQLPATPRNKGR